ncbi:MAG TPA: AAA family ATPase [Candidatus Dormibacteraeota bacterium]|nr:AAA family ATPase [Candidatus Dormibacteraeota bacterium]
MPAQSLCPLLIGRQEELASLEDALVAAMHGEGSMVVVTGEAGIGKTRLARELRETAERFGVATMWGGCSENELSLPYLPLLVAVNNHLAGVELAALAHRLGPMRRHLSTLFPQLGDRPAPSAADPKMARLHLFEATLALLHTLAGDRGALLIIEDLHWADAATRELLDYLARRVRAFPLLIVVTLRVGELPRRHPQRRVLDDWRRALLVRSVNLKPLQPAQLGAMAGTILERGDLPIELTGYLHERSEGNPLFLEELLKEVIDRSGDARRVDIWDTKLIDSLGVPSSIADNVVVRVERLRSSEARVVRVAAVLGGSFAPAALATIVGLDEAVVEEAVAACVRQQLLEPDADVGNFRFRHALTRQAVYQDIPPTKRRQLHGRVADHLMRQDEPAPPSEIAHHLIAAGRTAEAVPACFEAAEAALQRYAVREAATLYERCVPYVHDQAEKGALLCRLGEILQLADENRRALRRLADGVALLEGAGKVRAAARYRLALGRCHWELGDGPHAAAEYERARRVLEKDGPSADLARAYVRLAGMRVFDHVSDDGLALAERAVEISIEAQADGELAWALNYFGVALTQTGQVSAGLTALDRSYAQAMTHDLPWIADLALINAINVCLTALRPREAADRVEQLRALPVGRYRDVVLRMFDTNLAHVAGHVTTAVPVARDYLALVRDGEAHAHLPDASITLASVLVDAGRLHEAQQVLPSTAFHREIEAKLLTTTMRLHLALGETDAAAEIGRQVAGETGWSLPAVLSECAVEALIAAGDVGEAEAFMERSGLPFSAEAFRPLLDRARGRVELARGRADEGLALLSGAATALGAAGNHLQELWTIVDVARAQAAAGAQPDAVETLREVIRQARDGGAVAVADRALSVAEELGVLMQVVGAQPPPIPVMGRAHTEVAAQHGAGAVERIVSVMFADVRGSTELTAASVPADHAGRMATFYRWASRAVERHHGVLDKFAGDSVMATFMETLDHCVDALEAALSIQERGALLGLPVGAGVAVGPAVVGWLSQGTDLSVIGNVANLAARLQNAAQAGEVVLDAEAYRRARSWCDEHGVELTSVVLQLKGFSGDVPAYRARRLPKSLR